MLDDINALVQVHSDPTVSIVMPLERRRPGNDADRIRLRNLVAQAEQRVKAAYPADRARAVLARIGEARATLDLRHPGHGLAIVATDELAWARMLSFPVREAVVVDSTPFTRHLVQGLRRSPRFRVLVLSEKPTRLFEALRDDLVEVVDHGFPMTADFVTVDRRAVAGRFAMQPPGDDREGFKSFCRDVDRALTEASRDDPLPIVILGVDRSVATFRALSQHDRLVAGTVFGSYDDQSTHALGEIAWQVMREHLREQRRRAVDEIAEGVGNGRTVTGVDAVWEAAHQGRGHLLVVEEDFHGEPSRVVDGRLVRAAERDGPDVVEDPVDDIVEAVVQHGGRVEFVGNEALADHDRIAMLLRT